MPRDSAESPGTPEPGADPRRWRALAVCLIAGGMTLLDVSIVNVALPSLRAGLHAGDREIQLVVAGYALAFGVVLVPAGRLGDARSRRLMFAIGVTVFTLASAAAGAATGPTWIAVARIVQGVGGGLISPQVSGFIQNLFRGPERGRAFGLFGATIGVSTAIGPLLGGLLVRLGGPDFGWRLVFYVNVPVGIALLILIRRVLPAGQPGRRQSLDPIGVLIFAASVLLILYPVVSGGQGEALSARPWWLLAPAVAGLVIFVFWERFWRSREKETLMELGLLKLPSYVFGISLGTFYFAGFTSIFLITTLYLQTGLHYSALQAGATQMPFAVGSAFSAWMSGRLVQRFGRLLVVIGMVVVAIGLTSIDLLVPHLSGMVGLKLAPALLLTGLGGGMVVSPNVTLTLADVDPVHAGTGGGMLQTTQRVGSAIGVAVVLAQFFSRLGQTRGDFAGAFSHAMHTTIGLVLAALLLALIDLLRRRVRQRPEPADEPAAA
ncbi:MFS transporter [Microlunatus endophyticus]|uniref:MFS transporter n=1 Tax=Microlunatus endophyticus TaxID=1716077 RepID=A0A917S0Q6_9ACTN|nr:MFS transporter [Microlunatus endophyticus]GGL50380.1 MFS transporter [Microlunatus endophyticus]